MRLLLLCFQLLALISSTFVHYLLLVTLSLNFATVFFISIIMNNCFWYAVSIPNLELVFLTNLDGLILSVSQQLSRKYYTPLRESFARRGKKFVTKKFERLILLNKFVKKTSVGLLLNYLSFWA